MPPRYQQGQLSSSLVGTPGVDPSAGKVEAQIAEASGQARTQERRVAMQSLTQAQSDFNTARLQLFSSQQTNKVLERAQNEAILQSRLEGMETKAKTKLALLQTELESKYANDPDGVMSVAEERARSILQDMQPDTQDQRVAARFNVTGERALQGFLGGLGTWQMRQKAVNEKVDFDRDLEAFNDAAIAQGATGDFNKVIDLYESVESQAQKSRAFKLGPESENARQRTARGVLLSGVEALGQAKPEEALRISQDLMKRGLIKPAEVSKLEGDLQSHASYLHMLEERVRTENIRSVKTDFTKEFRGPMAVAINSRDLENADLIVRKATTERLRLERSGAPPEIVNEAQAQVESLQGMRNDAQRMTLEAERNRSLALGVQAQERSLLSVMQAMNQATPQAVEQRAKAYASVDVMMQALSRNEFSLEQKRKLIDDAERSIRSAESVLDRPFSGAPTLTSLLSQVNEANSRFRARVDADLKNAKLPGVSALRAARDPLAEIAGDENFMINSAWLKQPDEKLVGAVQRRDGKVGVSTIQAMVAERFLRNVALTRQRTPDVKFTRDMLEQIRQATQTDMVTELQRGR